VGSPLSRLIFLYNIFPLSPPDDPFTRPLVETLLSRLTARPRLLSRLSSNEHAHLLVLIQAALEVDEARRALDASGLRYLVALRSFCILNERADGPGAATPGPGRAGSNGGSIGATPVLSRATSPVPSRVATPIPTALRQVVQPRLGARGGAHGAGERMRYRDIVWAFHSESQGMLLAAAGSACQNKMCWADARALGVFMWLTNADTLVSYLVFLAYIFYSRAATENTDGGRRAR